VERYHEGRHALVVPTWNDRAGCILTMLACQHWNAYLGQSAALFANSRRTQKFDQQTVAPPQAVIAWVTGINGCCQPVFTACLQPLTSELQCPAKKNGRTKGNSRLLLSNNPRRRPVHFRSATRAVLITRPLNLSNHLLLGLLALSLTGCGGSSTPSRALLSIAVQPGSGEAVAPAGTLPFTATGTFDQAPTTQENMSAHWSSSDTTIATVDPATGVATCVSAGGPVVITAASGVKQGTAQLTCSVSPGSGNCVYECGSTRCGALTGFCSSTQGNACRQISALGSCPVGKPAGGTATDSCGIGIDTTRPCP
jgi:hypothetical protein